MTRRSAPSGGKHLSSTPPEAPRRLHRLAALMSLPLGHYRSRSGVEDSDLAISASCGDQAPVAVEAGAVERRHPGTKSP